MDQVCIIQINITYFNQQYVSVDMDPKLLSDMECAIQTKVLQTLKESDSTLVVHRWPH